MNIPIKYSYNPDYTPIAPVEYNEAVVEYTGSISATQEHFYFKTDEINESSLERTRIVEIEKLPCTWKNVYNMKLNGIKNFIPGDAIGLLVPNSDGIVDILMSLCGIKDAFCKVNRTGRSPFVYEGSIRDFFKYKYDFTGIPRKIHLLNLAKSSPLRAHIEYICSPEGAKDYLSLGLSWHSIVDIIGTFKCKPVIEDLIRNCELIKPRYYTLINSKNNSFKILIGEITKRGSTAIKYGHVSGFVNLLYKESMESTENSAIKNINWGGRLATIIETTFRRNTLIGKIDADCLICFCTGTGIALFLSLYENRPVGQEIILVYGYRNDEDDISRLYDLDCEIIRAKSSEGVRVTRHCSIVDPYKDNCRIVICGCEAMQRSVFLELRRLYPEIVQGKRIHLDNWK